MRICLGQSRAHGPSSPPTGSFANCHLDVLSRRAKDRCWLELGCPLHLKFPVMDGTVSKIEIDEALIRNPHLLRDRLEISDRITIQPHGDRLFQVFDVGVPVPSHFSKIVMVSHRLRLQYSCSSAVSAFRAEINRMTFSLSREQWQTTITRNL